MKFRTNELGLFLSVFPTSNCKTLTFMVVGLWIRPLAGRVRLLLSRHVAGMGGLRGPHL